MTLQVQLFNIYFIGFVVVVVVVDVAVVNERERCSSLIRMSNRSSSVAMMNITVLNLGLL